MNTPTVAPAHKRRLQAHFAFTGVPFRKNMWASKMFGSKAQRDLFLCLLTWIEVKGLALITGPSGVGKSITTRRFVQELDEQRYKVFRFASAPSTVAGFLRSLNRLLGLPMRAHSADLYDQAQRFLGTYATEHGPHPLLVMDDAESLSVAVLDLLRHLTAYDLDAEDRFSLLLVGTPDLLRHMANPILEPLRSRFNFAQPLRSFGKDDTRKYIDFHLKTAGVNRDLFTNEAANRIFQASRGKPRAINQLALQALIQASVEGLDAIDARYMQALIDAHPLYTHGLGGKACAPGT
jgi:type II secretory pathway predicted ATPase ExeA